MEVKTPFKLNIEQLQKAQRTLRKTGNIFPYEGEFIATLEAKIIIVQDDEALNAYYSMAQYLKQQIKELMRHLGTLQSGINEAFKDLTWSIQHLQWLTTKQKEESQ